MTTNTYGAGTGQDLGSSLTDGVDDPNRGPLDRAANALTGERGGIDAQMGQTATYGSASTASENRRVISAIFDTTDEARDAVAALRAEGVGDAHLSLITQHRGTTTQSNVDGDVVDEEHTSLLRGILGGGALGAGLGVAALAIPGVGPLVAAGAIAASAVPGAMAIGAAAGAAVGTGNELLKDHGIDDDDAAYYGGRMKDGGVLVTVHAPTGTPSEQQIRDILHSHGGHNASRAKNA